MSKKSICFLEKLIFEILSKEGTGKIKKEAVSDF